MITLSKRLQAIANLIEKCYSVADVGCDHGFLSIYLIENKIAEHVFAMDINSGPIERAQEHIRESRLENYIETIQCDGLTGLNYADTIVIAGMGGRLMLRILSDSPEVSKRANKLILEPQSELELFRKSLTEMGYKIEAEDFVLDEGKYYPIIRAVRGEMTLSRAEAMYGPLLIRDKNPVLKEFLMKEREYKLSILWNLTGNTPEEVTHEINEKTGRRVSELKEELALNESALRLMGD